MICSLIRSAAVAVLNRTQPPPPPRQPEPPRNVRIQRADGTVVPLELVYAGQVDIWEMATDVAWSLRNGDTLVADMMPPDCAIRTGSQGWS